MLRGGPWPLLNFSVIKMSVVLVSYQPVHYGLPYIMGHSNCCHWCGTSGLDEHKLAVSIPYPFVVLMLK